MSSENKEPLGILETEYSKVSLLLYEVIGYIKDNGCLPSNEEDILSADNILKTLEASNNSVRLDIIEKEIREEDDD